MLTDKWWHRHQWELIDKTVFKSPAEMAADRGGKIRSVGFGVLATDIFQGSVVYLFKCTVPGCGKTSTKRVRS